MKLDVLSLVRPELGPSLAWFDLRVNRRLCTARQPAARNSDTAMTGTWM